MFLTINDIKVFQVSVLFQICVTNIHAVLFVYKREKYFFLNLSDIKLNSSTCILTFTLYADCFMKIGCINSRRQNWKVIDDYYATNLEQLINIFLSFSLFKI